VAGVRLYRYGHGLVWCKNVNQISVLHLRIISASHQLNVLMNGQRLAFNPEPVYLRVMLDRTLSFKAHLQKTSAKLKNRNNLLSKLAGTTRGTQASTLHTAAMSLCYSVAEYCCHVRSRSSHVGLVDSQLNNAMHLVSGCVWPTQTPWLPVLAIIAPLALRRRDKLLCNIEAHPNWPLYSKLLVELNETKIKYEVKKDKKQCASSKDTQNLAWSLTCALIIKKNRRFALTRLKSRESA